MSGLAPELAAWELESASVPELGSAAALLHECVERPSTSHNSATCKVSKIEVPQILHRPKVVTTMRPSRQVSNSSSIAAIRWIP
jgi:hypothetical protein